MGLGGRAGGRASGGAPKPGMLGRQTAASHAAPALVCARARWAPRYLCTCQTDNSDQLPRPTAPRASACSIASVRTNTVTPQLAAALSSRWGGRGRVGHPGAWRAAQATARRRAWAYTSSPSLHKTPPNRPQRHAFANGGCGERQPARARHSEQEARDRRDRALCAARPGEPRGRHHARPAWRPGSSNPRYRVAIRRINNELRAALARPLRPPAHGCLALAAECGTSRCPLYSLQQLPSAPERHSQD